MDPLTEEIIRNFDRELDLYQKKSPNCLFDKYFALKGVTGHKIIHTEDHSTVIGTHSGRFVSGFCIVKYYNNTYYVGGISESLRSGSGSRSYLNSDLIYVGEYVKNMKCGKGKLWATNKKRWVFDGHWDRDMKNGYGEMWRETATYKGNWVDDRMDGIGRMDWVDGQKYEGSYAVDARNGEGSMVYVNGDKYTGTFKNGKPHGNGFYEWANGEIYEGSWYDGVMDGNGEINYQIPVSGKGSLRMGSLHELDFGLQTQKDWENNMMKSSQYIKSYRTSMIPESSRQVTRESMGGLFVASNSNSNFGKGTLTSIDGGNENVAMNGQMRGGSNLGYVSGGELVRDGENQIRRQSGDMVMMNADNQIRGQSGDMVMNAENGIRTQANGEVMALKMRTNMA